MCGDKLSTHIPVCDGFFNPFYGNRVKVYNVVDWRFKDLIRSRFRDEICVEL